ncbi:HAD family hydrolase [Boudabousia liubingyangii]|nr:HAD family hydrolase [Boudabousia liubingyangii]
MADNQIEQLAAFSHQAAPGAPSGSFVDLVMRARQDLPANLPADPHELMVALDIDGTIVQVDGTLSPRMMRAFRALREAGVTVVIASGRGLRGMEALCVMACEPGDYMVCANGALTMRVDSVAPLQLTEVSRHEFNPREALLALNEVLTEGELAVEVAGKYSKVTAPFGPGEMTGEQIICPLEEMLDEPVIRVMARRPKVNTDGLEQIAEDLGLHWVTYTVGPISLLDMAPKGVNKGTALEELRVRLGLPERGTFAFGDGWNDVQMLQWASCGVAMGDAPQGVVDQAEVRAGTVADDGVPAWVQAILGRYGLDTLK